jgi:hypothetical protein
MGIAELVLSFAEGAPPILQDTPPQNVGARANRKNHPGLRAFFQKITPGLNNDGSQTVTPEVSIGVHSEFNLDTC